MTTTELPDLDLKLHPSLQAEARGQADLIFDLFQDLRDADPNPSLIRETCYGADWETLTPSPYGRKDWPPRRGFWRPGEVVPAGRFYFCLGGNGPAIELRAIRRRRYSLRRTTVPNQSVVDWKQRYPGLAWFDEIEMWAQHWGTPWIPAMTSENAPIQEALRWFAGNCLLYLR